MNANGTRALSVYELHAHAQRCAERDGRPRWVCTIDYELRVIHPADFVISKDRHGKYTNWIERVAYPSYWRYRRD